jgi:hypothetical protein
LKSIALSEVTRCGIHTRTSSGRLAVTLSKPESQHSLIVAPPSGQPTNTSILYNCLTHRHPAQSSSKNVETLARLCYACRFTTNTPDHCKCRLPAHTERYRGIGTLCYRRTQYDVTSGFRIRSLALLPHMARVRRTSYNVRHASHHLGCRSRDKSLASAYWLFRHHAPRLTYNPRCAYGKSCSRISLPSYDTCFHYSTSQWLQLQAASHYPAEPISRLPYSTRERAPLYRTMRAKTRELYRPTVTVLGELVP